MCCTAIGLATGCITPYEPEADWINDMLVVEGSIIAPYGTTIKISGTDDGSSSFYDPDKPGTKATVTLITDDGSTVATAEKSGNTYTITDSISFQPGKKYAIHIQMDNKEYQSEFVEPQITPEIDEVNFLYKEQQEVNIRISTHNDTPNSSRFYRWTYEEDWEIISDYFAQYSWSEATGIIKLGQFTPNNIHYCWANNFSKRILLGSSDKASINKIKDHTILRLEPLNSRFSYLYSILVRQQALDRKAYEYFENIRKNVEQTGGLFSPQPTEIKGNITCLNDPDEIVIGYINAATETTYHLYIKAEEVPGMGDIFDCRDRVVFPGSMLSNAYGQGMAILSEAEVPGSYVCINRRCVDCTARGGGY
ncbi:MAG: DUF4249 domain-containing protein [Parabacteroides sp.]|nr:DUF4249 domain-containing protein [Parabacteroides sp.]